LSSSKSGGAKFRRLGFGIPTIGGIPSLVAVVVRQLSGGSFADDIDFVDVAAAANAAVAADTPPMPLPFPPSCAYEPPPMPLPLPPSCAYEQRRTLKR